MENETLIKKGVMNKKVFYLFQVVWLSISFPFSKSYTATKCKHRTKAKGQIKLLNGKRDILTMKVSGDGTLEYCLKCISKMAIKCPLCHSPISIGDPITYREAEGFKEPLICCFNLDCVHAYIPNGFWMPPGMVSETDG